MKKLSLLLVFVMLLVAMLAFSVFAEDTNVAKEAEASTTVKSWVVTATGQTSWYSSQVPNINDGKYDKGVCGGMNEGGEKSYTLTFDNAMKVSSVKLFVNGTANTGHVSDYTTKPANLATMIKVTMRNASGTVVYDSGDKISAKDRLEIEFKPEMPVEGVLYVDVIYDNSSSTNSIILREVEVYKHTCEFNTFVKTQKAVTCLENGVDIYACNCSAQEERAVIAKGTHTWDAGTENDAGTAMVYYCTIPGCDGTQSVELNHTCSFETYVGISKEPTCVEYGSATYRCRCDATTEKPVEPTGIHNYTEFVGYAEGKAPTYLKDGVSIYKCATCEATEEFFAARLIYNLTKYATISAGDTDYWTVTEENLIDGDITVGSASSNSGGASTHIFTISFGEECYFDEIVVVTNSTGHFPASGAFNWDRKTSHNYTFSVILRDEEGNAIYDSGSLRSINDAQEYVTDDGIEYDAVTITFEESVRAYTLEVRLNRGGNSDGLWEITAYGLPVNYHEEHTYTVLQETITPATCAEAGLGVYRCAKCEETTEAAIPATGKHTGGTATCTEKAICSVCEQPYGEALGHDVSIPATCASAAKCSRCDYTEGEKAAHGKYSWQKGGCEVCGVLDEDFYNIVYADDINDIKNAPAGSIVRLQNNLSFNYDTITNAITLDLCGHTIATSLANGGMIINNAEFVLVNGTIEHSGAVACLRFKAVKKLEGLTIRATKGGNSITGGFQIQGTCTNIESINNITFEGVALGVGIEIASGAYVKEIDHVTISVSKAGNNTTSAQHQHLIGIIVNGKCDSISNSTITASYSSGYTLNELSNNTGIYIGNGNAIKLSNCTVNAEEQAVYVNGSSANLTFENTTFGGNGALINSSVAVSGLTDVAVATIGNKYFATLEKAIAAANAGETIKLVKDIDLATAIVVNKEATIDLNGKTLSVSKDTEGNGVFMVVENGVLTINGEGIVNGVGNNIYNIAIFANGGKVIINGGTYTNVGESLTEDHYDLIYVKNGGIVEINGGTFLAQTPKWTLNSHDKLTGTFVVKGGTFQEGFNPGATETEPADANNDFIAAGYYLNGNTVEKCEAHNATELTCTEDSVCTICQLVVAEAQGHTMADATCTAPKTCTVCGTTEGEALGHSWQEATCTTAKTCTVCKATEGEALGHKSDVPATCQNPAVCKVCGEKFGDLATHTIVIDAAVAPTCTETGLTEGSHCSVCNVTLVAQQTVEKLDHTEETIPAVDPTCAAVGYTAGVKCSVCQTVLTAPQEVAKLAHTWNWTKELGHHCSVCKGGESLFNVVEVKASGISGAVNNANTSTVTIIRVTEGGTIDRIYAEKYYVLDLNGCTVGTTSNWGGFTLYYGSSIVSSKDGGTLIHSGNTCAVKVVQANKIENITIIGQNDSEDKTIGGIVVQEYKTTRPTHINSIKDVVFKGEDLSNAIQTYKCGLSTTPVIDVIDNVTINAQWNGILNNAPIGTISNSTIYGGISGISFEANNHECSYNTASVNFVNSTISGGEQAILFCDKCATKISISSDARTKFSSTTGEIFTFLDVWNSSTSQNGSDGVYTVFALDMVGYTVDANGAIVICPHTNVTAGSCTVESVCKECEAILGFVHTYNETSRVESTCREAGVVYYACDCGATKHEYLQYADHVLGNGDWIYNAVDKVMYKTCANCSEVMATAPVVAKINGIGYASLEDAVAVGGEITLEADIDLATAVEINNNVIINLNGKTLTVSEDTEGNGVFMVVENGVLTINGEGTVNGVGNNNYNIAIWANGGSVVINGGTFTNVGATDENGDDHFDLIYAKNGGSVVINGGTFIAQTPKWTLNAKDNDGSTIVVNGGSFYMYNPTESASENPVVDFTSGKCAVKNSENYYVVGEHVYFNSCDARCEACGKITREPTHNIIHVVAKTPTCTEIGNLEYWYCDICGAAWLDQALTLNTNLMAVKLPMAEHEYFYPCDPVCMNCYEITNLDAAHEIVHVDAVAPTCTENGNIEHWYCEYCNTAWLDEALTQLTNRFNVIVPATGHSYNYACDKACAVCYEITRPEAEHTIVHVDAKAATCTTNGNEEYWYCSDCGYAWLDEALTLVANQMSVIVPATGHSYNYACDKACAVCYEITRPEAEHTIVHVDAKASTCTAIGNIEFWYCEVCGGAWLDEALTLNTNLMAVKLPMADHTPAEAVVENNIPATSTTAGSYDKVVYCSVCEAELSRETVTVEPTCKHTNTEIYQEAVLPTPSKAGYTAGVKCADCDEIISAPSAVTVTDMAQMGDPSFRIDAVSLDLADSICVFYKIKSSDAYQNPYMVFVFGGEEFPVTNYTIEPGTGRYVFRFTGAPAYKMAENIEAYVYSETSSGEYTRNMFLNYSIMKYCTNQLKNTSISTQFRTVISDVLTLGAANQIYEGYKTDELVTDLVTKAGYTLTPSKFESIDASKNKQTMVGDATASTNWTTANLVIGSNVKVQLKLKTQDLENVTVKITVDGEDRYFTAKDFDVDGDYYVVVIDYLTSKQYDEAITASLYLGEEQVGGTLTYSINSYLFRNAENSKHDENMRTLLQALYTYGETMKAYFAD